MGLAPESQRAFVLTADRSSFQQSHPFGSAHVPKPEHQEPQDRVRNCTHHLEQVVSGAGQRNAVSFTSVLVKLNLFMAPEQKLFL